MRSLVLVLQVSLIFLQRHPAKIAAVSQFRGFEVAAQALEVLEDLVGQFPSVAGHDAGVGHVLPVLSRLDLVEHRDHEHRGLAHARLGLAQDVAALQDVRDGVHLHFAGVLEPTLPDRPLQLVLQEQFVPAHQVGSELVLPSGFLSLHLLLIGAVVVVVWDIHLNSPTN